MKATLLQYGLWISSVVGYVVLLVVFVIKKRYRDFPVFFGFIIYELIDNSALAIALHYSSAALYFKTYWTLATFDEMFQIALIYEMARHTLKFAGRWIRNAQFSFLLWSTVSLLVATVIAFGAAPPHRNGLQLWAVRSSVFTSFLTCEIFAAMSLTANRLELPWRSHVMKLGEGLTFWAAVALFTDASKLLTGWSHYVMYLDNIRSLAYLGTLGYWAVSFYAAETRQAPRPEEVRLYLSALHKRVRHDLHTLRSGGKYL